MRLYYNKLSRASRVRWALEELEVPYELETVNLRDEGFDREAYSKIHPMTQIPALVDGEHVVFETGAIIMYLADKFGKLAPAPTNIAARGEYYTWMFFAMTELDRYVLEVFLQTRLYDDEKRSAAVEKAAREGFARRAKVLSERLSKQSYMLGEEFGMVDVLVASILGWAKAQGLLEDFPDLVRYSEESHNRPACLRSQADV